MPDGDATGVPGSGVPADPMALLKSLSADAISARLDELDQERDALRVLLRSARVRERHRARDDKLRREREKAKGTPDDAQAPAP